MLEECPSNAAPLLLEHLHGVQTELLSFLFTCCACLLPSCAEGEEETAQLHIRKVAHTGGINRVRACPQQPHIVASFADTAQVQVRRCVFRLWVHCGADLGRSMLHGTRSRCLPARSLARASLCALGLAACLRSGTSARS